MTEMPARTASRASVTAYSPGTETSARSAPERRIAPPRVRACGAAPSPPDASAAERVRVRAPSSAASPASTPDASPRIAMMRSFGRGGRHLEAHPADDVEVELGRHRDLRGLDPGRGGDGPGDLHQGHGVEVASGSQLDVVSHGGLLRWGAGGRWVASCDGAEGAGDPAEQVATGGVPDGEHAPDEVVEVVRSSRSARRRRVARARRVTRRTTSGTAYPAAGGDQQGGREARRRRQHGADRARARPSSARRAGESRAHASVSRMPQSTSSPLGVRPRPTPTRPADTGDGRSGPRGRRGEGVREVTEHTGLRAADAMTAVAARGCGRTRAGRKRRVATTSARGSRTRPSPTTT